MPDEIRTFEAPRRPAGTGSLLCFDKLRGMRPLLRFKTFDILPKFAAGTDQFSVENEDVDINIFWPTI